MRRVFELFDRGETEALLRYVDPAIETNEGAELPGTASYVGHAGLATAYDHWASQWDDFRVELTELIDGGSDVVAVTRHRGTGRASGVAVEALVAYVFTVDDGRLVRMRIFQYEGPGPRSRGGAGITGRPALGISTSGREGIRAERGRLDASQKRSWSLPRGERAPAATSSCHGPNHQARRLAVNWKLRLRRRRTVALAISACVFIVAVPAAVAQTTYQDLRSPDARDAALAAEEAAKPEADSQIYVNPSTGFASGAGSASQDLRSPDTRDAAAGITTGSVPAPAPLAVERRTVVTIDESSSQTLAIVFSASALLIALMSVGFVALARRPRPRWTAS